MQGACYYNISRKFLLVNVILARIFLKEMQSLEDLQLINSFQDCCKILARDAILRKPRYALPCRILQDSLKTFASEAVFLNQCYSTRLANENQNAQKPKN